MLHSFLTCFRLIRCFSPPIQVLQGHTWRGKVCILSRRDVCKHLLWFWAQECCWLAWTSEFLRRVIMSLRPSDSGFSSVEPSTNYSNQIPSCNTTPGHSSTSPQPTRLFSWHPEGRGSRECPSPSPCALSGRSPLRWPPQPHPCPQHSAQECTGPTLVQRPQLPRGAWFRVLQALPASSIYFTYCCLENKAMPGNFVKRSCAIMEKSLL